MNKRTRHATEQARGSIKEAIGMLIGDEKVQAEGAAEKAIGEQQGSGAGSAVPKVVPQA